MKRCESILPSITNCFEKIDSCARKMGISKEMELSIYPEREPFSLNASAGLGKIKSFIAIGPLLLVDPRNIPSKFQIQDFNDPLLDNPAFIDDFIAWLNNEYLKIDNLNPSEVLEDDRNAVKRLLILVKNPDLFDKVVEFTLAHEAAHHLHEHMQNPPIKMGDKKTLSLTLGSALLCGMSGALISHSKKVLGGLSGSLLGGLGGFTLGAFLTLRYYNLCKYKEQEADLTAIDALQDASGALYEFDTELQLNSYLMKQKSLEQKKETITKMRQAYWFSDHPSHEERIAYIQAFQNKLPLKKIQYFAPAVPFQFGP